MTVPSYFVDDLQVMLRQLNHVAYLLFELKQLSNCNCFRMTSQFLVLEFWVWVCFKRKLWDWGSPTCCSRTSHGKLRHNIIIQHIFSFHSQTSPSTLWRARSVSTLTSDEDTTHPSLKFLGFTESANGRPRRRWPRVRTTRGRARSNIHSSGDTFARRSPKTDCLISLWALIITLLLIA